MPAPAAAPALRVDHVSYRHRHGSAAFGLRDVSLDLRPGETCALMGHNGSGKTTLLRLAGGLLRPHQGQVLIGTNGAQRPVTAPPPEIGYIPQHLGLLRARSLEQNVLLGALGRLRGWRAFTGNYPDEERERARRLLDLVGLGARASDKVHRLSGGERQRVAIARALMKDPRVLLADEFAANLDPVRQREILDLVKEQLRHHNVATLMALHNLDLARTFADRILFMREGSIVADLPATDVTPEVAQRNLTH